jgi:hypothetical protein
MRHQEGCRAEQRLATAVFVCARLGLKADRIMPIHGRIVPFADAEAAAKSVAPTQTTP